MKKFSIILLLIILLLLILCSCSNSSNFISPNSSDISAITDFSFSESNGFIENGWFLYSAKLENNLPVVTIKPEGQPEDSTVTIQTEIPVMERLGEIVKKYDLGNWNEFNKTNTDVLDGSSFNISICMDNNQSITADGYEAYPPNYKEASAEIKELFIEIYESKYPNKEKALEKFYQDNILGSHDEITDYQVNYNYLSDGDNQFNFSEYINGQEGVITHSVLDLDGDNISELIVFFQKSNSANSERTQNYWEQYFEIYSIDDNMEIKLSGQETLDDDSYWNDNQYTQIFLHDTYNPDQTRLICICTKKCYKAGDQNKYIDIVIYEYKDKKITLLADEGQYGPIYDEWTFNELSNFTDIAEKYSFSESLDYWRKNPSDPVVNTWDISYSFYGIFTDTNYDNDFYETLINTKKGEPVGNYKVNGEITVMH